MLSWPSQTLCVGVSCLIGGTSACRLVAPDSHHSRRINWRFLGFSQVSRSTPHPVWTELHFKRVAQHLSRQNTVLIWGYRHLCGEVWGSVNFGEWVSLRKEGQI